MFLCFQDSFRQGRGKGVGGGGVAVHRLGRSEDIKDKRMDEKWKIKYVYV